MNRMEEKELQKRLVEESARAAGSGNLPGIINSVRHSIGTAQEQKVLDTLVQNMGVRGVENLDAFIQTAFSENRNITNTNSRELVMLSTVLIGAQVKNGSPITDTSHELEAIENNPDLPPEVRGMAKDTKEKVEYAKFERADKVFQEIKKQKLERVAEKSQSFKSA